MGIPKYHLKTVDAGIKLLGQSGAGRLSRVCANVCGRDEKCYLRPDEASIVARWCSHQVQDDRGGIL